MMNKRIWVLIILLIVGVLIANFVNNFVSKDNSQIILDDADDEREGVSELDMQLTTTIFNNGEAIPSKYTCDGEDINPSLSISDIPEGTASLALIVDDPDAPDGDWVHWLVWNLDPSLSYIAENDTLADAVIGLNDFGNNNYGGPCPPSGTHRYQFKLYALDTSLDLASSSKKEELLSAMQGHILSHEQLVGT